MTLRDSTCPTALACKGSTERVPCLTIFSIPSRIFSIIRGKLGCVGAAEAAPTHPAPHLLRRYPPTPLQRLRKVLVLSPCDVFPPVHGSSTAIYHTLQFLSETNQVSALLCYPVLAARRGGPGQPNPGLSATAANRPSTGWDTRACSLTPSTTGPPASSPANSSPTSSRPNCSGRRQPPSGCASGWACRWS